ncbi:RnfH family protein [Sessilibacter sp. MAH2]
MKVSVAYTVGGAQFWQNVVVDEDATVEDAINKSGVLDNYDINLKRQKIGVYGKFTKLTAALNEGDRIEIYEPIIRVLDEDDDDDD